MIKTTIIDTPLGEMIAGATEDGVCLLEFTDRKILPYEYNELTGLLSTTIEAGDNIHLKSLRKQLKEYFKGNLKEFNIPLITPGSKFQQEVWKELLTIEFGATRTYLEQSLELGHPEAIRAVANANGRNRIAIIIPCHRVIGSGGKLTGYGGGLERKKWLLDHEKRYSGQPADLTLF